MESEATLIVPYQRVCGLLPEDIVEILELYDLWQLALKRVMEDERPRRS